MCGIAAILLYPKERSDEDWQILRDVFTRNMLFNEERGKEATGLAVIQADGEVTLRKMPLTATEFVATPEYYGLMASIGPQTTLLLGHTRRPTQGDPANNGNNHPLQAGTIFGVHNGHIQNDDDLFTRCGYPRQAQVDSEIIFRLLEPLSPLQSNGSYLAEVRSQWQLLRGEFALLACDWRAPEKLLVVKHHKPLCLHFHAKWKALIFSSLHTFLREAFGPAAVIELLPHDQLLLFDAHALAQLGRCPADALPLGFPGGGALEFTAREKTNA